MSEDLALSTTGNPMVSLYGLDAGERRCGARVLQRPARARALQRAHAGSSQRICLGSLRAVPPEVRARRAGRRHRKESDMKKLRVQIITQDDQVVARIYRGEDLLCTRTWVITAGGGYRAVKHGTLSDDLNALATAEAPEEDLDDFDDAVLNAIGGVVEMLCLAGEILS